MCACACKESASARYAYTAAQDLVIRPQNCKHNEQESKRGGGERKTACKRGKKRKTAGKTGFDDGEYFLVLFCEKKLFFFLCVSTKH